MKKKVLFCKIEQGDLDDSFQKDPITPHHGFGTLHDPPAKCKKKFEKVAHSHEFQVLYNFTLFDFALHYERVHK